jgi:ATP-dependent exoDNAse (exonuclease V) alpha subunit
VWSTACVLADEARIAELAEALVAQRGPVVPGGVATSAVTDLEGRLGGRLNDAQRAVAVGVMTAGHRLDVVVGVAGSGKTTTLAAVRAGFETAGYSVVGTATSGQAAKTLGDGAGMESRTVASLTWRLEHGTLALSDRHVLIVDEGAMTTDFDLGRLLGAVECSGAKVVMVGDDRQVGAVGPAAPTGPWPGVIPATCGH